MAETLMRMYETMNAAEQKELYDFALFLLSRNEEKVVLQKKSYFGALKDKISYIAPDFDEPAKDFDYTKWRHSFVDNINTFEELDAFVEQSKNKAQFQGNAKEIL